MTAVTSDTTPAPAADPATVGPFAAARERLERLLAGRHAREGRPPLLGAAAPPTVVPLGAADTLGGGDPWAGVRPGARVHLTSRAVLLGPWVPAAAGAATGTPSPAGPPAEACGRCLAMRWQRLRSRSEREALELGHHPGGGSAWPALTDHALDAVWHTLRALPLAAPPAEPELPQVTRIDLVTLAVVTVPLLPDPLCPHCVTPRPDTAEAAWPERTPRPKPAVDGYRLRSLDSYALPTAALANPVCGALGAVTHLNPASTTTAPVSGSHFVRGYAGLNDVTWSGQANAYATSRKLAYLEGLERYAGTHRRRGTRPVLGSLRELTAREGAHAVLDPRTCGEYAPETYETDPLLSPFDPDREIPWIRGHSLRGGRPVLVPARLVHYGAGVEADNFVFECSNGCATGSCPEEAALFGLLELVERDAFLMSWYGRSPIRRIDPALGTGPAVRSMLDRAALHGYDVRAFDSRAGLPVPVVTALAVRRDGGPGTLSFAAAAGFDPLETLESALSEVLTYIAHLPFQVADRLPELEAMAEDHDRVLHLTDHAQLYGLPRMAAHAPEYLTDEEPVPLTEAFADWAERRPRTGDLVDDLHLLRDELAGAGFDAIAVDQTTPEQARLGLHTVATIVPGLLPLDFGWRRQRALRMPRLLDHLAGRPARLIPHPFP
ncbi:TOMM precursor leader peptide-binding protein [Streptomyces spiramenti]|uniref:TOMM leader peptide-binding protein n=1 Tax=Streptomyces spiramenti TaxID=2720606 RepID=A0ABX1ALR4_9ACTN|nr:TOMM precursor leader peptide-binding protein [Streptomyces spiramenti]NJP66961.1 TOMM precursor leader peptide-binding protein [Streptomyces spiramenti]